jgi:hypothetical protein
MILKNYYKMLYMYMHGSCDITSKNGNVVTNTAPSGASQKAEMIDALSFSGMKKPLGISIDDNTVLIGTGTSEVSFDDTWLSGDIISTINSTAQHSSEITDKYCKLTTVYTITNTSSDEISIGEIGFVGEAPNSTFLMDRTVLNNPLVIESGGVGQLTYEITFNYPTA